MLLRLQSADVAEPNVEQARLRQQREVLERAHLGQLIFDCLKKTLNVQIGVPRDAWLRRPCSYLDGSAPMDLVDHTFEVQAVEAYLGRVLHGVYQ